MEGIGIFGVINSNICCNTIMNADVRLSVNGACNTTILGETTFSGTHRVGLQYGTSAITGNSSVTEAQIFTNYRLDVLEGSPCDTILTTSIAAPNRPTSIYVYPNPASEYTHLQIEVQDYQNGEWQIYNSLGQLMTSLPLSPTKEHYQLSVDQWSKGIYFYSVVINGAEIKSGKLILVE